MNIIEKVKRLRALAQSDNVNEAANAAAAAERLIQEHNLGEAEFAEPDDTVDAVELEQTGRVIKWKSYLRVTLGQAYQCRTTAYPPIVKIYGRAADIEIFRYQYAFFTSEIDRLASNLCKDMGKTYANSFRLGAVSAIEASLVKAQSEAKEHATPGALVVIDQRRAAVDAAIGHIKTRKSTPTRLDRSAYDHGQKAGSAINQWSQIGATGQQLLAR